MHVKKLVVDGVEVPVKDRVEVWIDAADRQEDGWNAYRFDFFTQSGLAIKAGRLETTIEGIADCLIWYMMVDAMYAIGMSIMTEDDLCNNGTVHNEMYLEPGIPPYDDTHSNN